MQTIGDVTSSNIKRTLNVLGPNETVRDRRWKKSVQKAKILVTDFRDIRFRVVEIAEECCVVHHGGRESDNRYSLTRFAKEIGVAKGTLMEWWRLKHNIYDNLPEYRKKKMTYCGLGHLDTEMRGEDRNNPIEFKRTLKKRLKALDAKTQTTIKMERYLKHLKTIQFNTKNRLMIKDCDKEVLGEICHIARDIVNHLSKYDRK